VTTIKLAAKLSVVKTQAKSLRQQAGYFFLAILRTIRSPLPWLLIHSVPAY